MNVYPLMGTTVFKEALRMNCIAIPLKITTERGHNLCFWKRAELNIGSRKILINFLLFKQRSPYSDLITN